MEQSTSAKDIWINLEETYQSKEETRKILKTTPSRLAKVKNHPKTLDFIISKCDLEKISSEDKESK